MIRPLYANPNAKPGSWGKAECADALMQIASTVDVLSRQLDRFWSLADNNLRANFDAAMHSPFDFIDTTLATKIKAHAEFLQAAADREAV